MRIRLPALVATLVGAGALAGAAWARTIEVAPGGDAHEAIQGALIDAKPGDTVHIAAGRYDLADGLTLATPDVTVSGDGPGKTILAFDRQEGGAEGLLITADRDTVRGFSVLNPKSNGIKAKGVDRVSFIDLDVEWSGGPKETNGPYGVYPVSSTNVLIDHVTAKGASDTGLYVGQSKNVVIQNSTAEQNVSGIEIENCYSADVHDNRAAHNAGGVLIFDLPGLPQMGGHSTRVFNNEVVDNDTPNFAPKGNIVANVPTGTGIMVMANRAVHVFDNHIDGNASVAIMVVAYVNAFDDARYDPLPRDIAIHDNQFGRNGFAPVFDGGPILAKMLGGAIPPVMWDGVTAYRIPGGGSSTDVVRLAIADGPVVNLSLGLQGTPVQKADPKVTPNLVDARLAEPMPVALPAAQLALIGPPRH